MYSLNTSAQRSLHSTNEAVTSHCQTTQQTGKITFPALDGLRFFAAIAVVLFHYLSQVNNFLSLPVWVISLVKTGPTAVPFFYILSGFVLAHTYGQLGNARAMATKKLQFWIARFARVYPAYLLAFFLFVPMAFVKYIYHPIPGSRSGAGTFVASAILYCTMLQSWTPLSQGWNGPGWSVSVEAFFYTVFPWLVAATLFAKRLKGLVICGILSLLPSVMIIGHLMQVVPEKPWLDYIRNNPVFWLPSFLLGIAIAPYAASWGQVRARTATFWAVISLSCLLIIAALCPDSLRDLPVHGSLGLILALIVLCFTHPTAISSRLLGGRVLSSLGRASYGLYIIQSPVWHYFRELLKKIHSYLGDRDSVSALEFGVFLIMLVGCSVVLEKYLERPARELIRSVLNSRIADQSRALAVSASNNGVAKSGSSDSKSDPGYNDAVSVQ